MTERWVKDLHDAAEEQRQVDAGCVGPWEPEPLWMRLQKCRAMLHIRGFLSEAENRSVLKRLRREYPREFCDMCRSLARDNLGPCDEHGPLGVG